MKKVAPKKDAVQVWYIPSTDTLHIRRPDNFIEIYDKDIKIWYARVGSVFSDLEHLTLKGEFVCNL